MKSYMRNRLSNLVLLMRQSGKTQNSVLSGRLRTFRRESNTIWPQKFHTDCVNQC